MYKALIDTQSIKNKKWLKTLKIVGEYEEKWPREEIPVLYVVRVEVKNSKIKKLVNYLSKNIIKGWFAVVWNKKEVIVIMKGKLLNLRSPLVINSKEWKSLVSYGETQKIGKKYFINMKKVMGEWR